jgi:hypothetical protein
MYFVCATWVLVPDVVGDIRPCQCHISNHSDIHYPLWHNNAEDPKHVKIDTRTFELRLPTRFCPNPAAHPSSIVPQCCHSVRADGRCGVRHSLLSRATSPSSYATAPRHLFNTLSIMRASPVSPFPKSSLAWSVGRFPTEILQEIVILALGQYLTDILLAPESTRSWDGISVLLHINHCFRCCALKVLNVLWEGTFVDRKTGCVFVSPLRDLAHSSKGCW